MKKVAIITLNYNGKEDTLELLGSLAKCHNSAIESQIIVVDNASSDNSISKIQEKFPEVTLLQTGSNLGFSGGFNKGIEYATIWGADYFLLINNDCVIKDVDLISQLIDTVKQDPKIGLVSPKIYFAPGFEFHKDRYKDTEVGKVIWYAGGDFDWNNIGSIHRGLDEVDAGNYNDIEKTNLISGACVLITKEVIEKVGLFDEKYFLYFEDSDFIKRVQEAGFKLFYNGKVSIYHKVSRSTGIGSQITDYFHARNRLYFGFKYSSFRTKFALLREAIKLLLFGRKTQRLGIKDFFAGKTGGAFLTATENKADIQYPNKFSIVAVNYNTAELMKKLLESIFNKKSGFDPTNMEVVILDNGSSDNCRDKIKEFLPKIKFLQNEENTGFSRGYNKAIRYSNGEFILMLNSDIELLENSLTEMLKAIEKFGDNAVLGGKLYFPDGSNQDSCFHLPDLKGAFEEYFLGRKGSYFMFLPDTEKYTKVDGLVMACFLIPTKVINKIGLLDESTFIFFEDIEYCRRLSQFNIPIYFIPNAHFIHHHGASTKKIGQDKAYKLLQESSKRYHGMIYYQLLSLVLRFGQKFGKVSTPISRWTKT